MNILLYFKRYTVQERFNKLSDKHTHKTHTHVVNKTFFNCLAMSTVISNRLSTFAVGFC